MDDKENRLDTQLFESIPETIILSENYFDSKRKSKEKNLSKEEDLISNISENLKGKTDKIGGVEIET